MKRYFIVGAMTMCLSVGITNVLNAQPAPSARPSTSNYTDNLITEGPDIGQGVEPFINLINNATKTIQITIYELQDTSTTASTNLQDALMAAAARGVNVQIIYSSGTDMSSYQEAEAAFCSAANNKYSNFSCEESSTAFTYTHEKSFVIDYGQPDAEAIIMTLNWVNNGAYNYFNGDTRDFAIMTNNLYDVQTLENEFVADWHNAQNNSSTFPTITANSRLFFSNSSLTNAQMQGDSYTSIYNLISSAKQTVDIYTEELESTNYSAGTSAGEDLIQLINTKASEGIKFRIITEDCTATQYNDLKLGPNVQVITVPTSNPIYYHAKAVIVDGKIADVMSVNFSQTSIYNNREAGILLSPGTDGDPNPIAQTLQNTFDTDWNTLTSSPYNYTSSCTEDNSILQN